MSCLDCKVEHVVKGLVEVVADLLDLELLLQQVLLNLQYTKVFKKPYRHKLLVDYETPCIYM